MKKVNLVITDLDDTIWDWLKMWYTSFHPFLMGIHEATGVDLATLKAGFKALHQQYGTSEVSFAYKELKILSDQQKKLIEQENNGPSLIHQYNRNRKQNLILYDGVLQTLLALKCQGVKLAGFTESNSFYTKYRLKTLGIDGLFDIIYTPDDHGLPPTVKRFYKEDHWEPKCTEFHVLPNGTRKPNPEVLKQIVSDIQGAIENTIYIGDKLDKDIYMANQAEVTSVHASYGHQIETKAYELLRAVTHWSDVEVQRERDTKNALWGFQVSPDLTIQNFEEILGKFEFVRFKRAMSEKDNIIEIWKAVVEVQKHFNDIAIRIRSLALTLFTFFLGGIGFSFREHVTINLFGLTIPLSAIIGLFGFLSMYAFYFMDKYWYHQFLVGSVNKGLEIENAYRQEFPNLNLAKTISDKSKEKIFFGRLSVRSDQKINVFYSLLLVPLFIAFALLMFFDTQSEQVAQYNNVKANSVLLRSSQDFGRAPEAAGVVLIVDERGNIANVIGTENIRSTLVTVGAPDTLGFYRYRYAVVTSDVKELENYIRKEGIEFRGITAP